MFTPDEEIAYQKVVEAIASGIITEEGITVFLLKKREEEDKNFDPTKCHSLLSWEEPRLPAFR